MDQSELVSLLTDDTTSLLERTYFELRVDEEFKKSRRFGWDTSLLVIEVDGLQRILESQGEKGLRASLLDIAGIVLTESRDVDLSAYLGENRFAMLLPGTSADGATQMVQRVISMILDRFDGELVAHVGLSDSPREGVDTSAELFGRADRGIAVARNQGENQLVHWTTAAE